MRCLIAAEPGAAEVIRENLQRRYSQDKFETVTDPDLLLGCAREGKVPDAILLSRFLPGAQEILRFLPVMFPGCPVIILTGILNEQAKAFLRQAAEYGLTDTVTGKLPGDKPYTLFAALERIRQKGQKKVVIAYGLQEEGAVVCASMEETRQRARQADLVLVGSRAKDAEKCVRTLRAAGIAAPIVVVGPYRIDLIGAGATGCVERAEDALKFLE
jgi:hypothetical protein